MKPTEYIPEGSWLTFIKQTVKPKRGSVGNTKNESVAKAIYKCKCGAIVEKYIWSVKSGKVRSCGCIRKHVIHINAQNKTHGLSGHPLYSIWNGIKARCYYEKSNRYHLYGEKGVVMCDEWLKHPEKFIQWALDNGWKKGLQIDKDIIPKKLGIPAKLYSPEMCSIVTHKENGFNKMNITMYEYNGKKQSLYDWSIELKMKKSTLYDRVQVMPIEQAFSLKFGKHWKSHKRVGKLITYNGETKSLGDWLTEIGISRGTYYDRVNTGNTSLDYLLAPNKRPSVSKKLKLKN